MQISYRNGFLFAAGLLLVLAIVPCSPAPARAGCFIGGEITAERNDDPRYSDWKYTAVIEWDTASRYGLSHLDILIDAVDGSCTCYQIASALGSCTVMGRSDGVGGCEAEFEAHVECNGDPSISGLEGILLKFEPIDSECEPGTTGTLTFSFFSDYGPAPIDEEVLALFDKYAGLFCSGYLSGEFPSLSCNPVDTDKATWDILKSLYR